MSSSSETLPREEEQSVLFHMEPFMVLVYIRQV